MSIVENRKLSAYGLPADPRFVRLFSEGFLWGLLAESVTLLGLKATGNLTFQGLDQHGWGVARYACLWAMTFLAVGLFEESLFRGYPQFALTRVLSFWPAAIITSSFFWWQHMDNSGETLLGGLDTAVAAIIFCLALRRTGSLWWPIGLHAGWDWAETYFYGVPDSGMPADGHLLNSTLHGSAWMTGGTAGPEASLVELLVSVILLSLLIRRFPVIKYPTRSSALD